MSVLFHPPLGRFVDAAESHPSDSEGGGYGRRVSSAARVTRREAGDHGAPGSRRFRRFLNANMSESELDTEGEWDSDEDRPVVRFEWQAKFVQAGTDFF